MYAKAPQTKLSNAYLFYLPIHPIYIVCSKIFSGLSAFKKKKSKLTVTFKTLLQLARDQNFPFYPHKHPIQMAKGVYRHSLKILWIWIQST